MTGGHSTAAAHQDQAPMPQSGNCAAPAQELYLAGGPDGRPLSRDITSGPPQAALSTRRPTREPTLTDIETRTREGPSPQPRGLPAPAQKLYRR
jgi:hypothetical protein